MKIQKIDEFETTKTYHFCVITCWNEIENCGIFETEEDMNLWILNNVNERLNDNSDFDKNLEGMYQNEKGRTVFIDVVKAMDWFRDDAWDIIYDSSPIYSNIDDIYDIELVKKMNKYNL